MNSTVLGALAVMSASSLGFAGSTDGEYMSLDRELDNLATSLSSQGPGGIGLSGFFRTSFDMIDQDVAGATDDEMGVTVDNARLNFDADAGAGYGMHVALEAGGGTADLFEAYGTFKLGEQVKGRIGEFRAPFLWQGLVDENHLLFNDHLTGGYTLNGLVAHDGLRDLGVSFSGGMDRFTWAVSGQNGSDALLDEFLFSGRATFTAMGPGVGMQEGAYNATDESNLVLGVGIFDDGAFDDGMGLGFDAVFTAGQLYAHASVADYDKDLGDNTPWDVTVSYMISPNQWEIAGRYEDWDDPNNTDHMAVGANYYANGHNAKWQLQLDSYSSDTIPDGTSISLSLVLGA